MMISERKGNKMRKKIRSFFSIVLVLTLVFAVAPLPKATLAAEPQKFQMTGIVESETANGHLLINTNIGDFGTYGLNIFTICTGGGSYYAGTSAADAVQQSWAATYTFAEGRVFFESLLNALGSGVTYIRIAEGTRFTFGGKVFELEKDFAIAKESGAWTVKEEPAEPQKFEMTGIVESETANGHLLINTNIGDFGTYGLNIFTICTGGGSYYAGTSAADAVQQSWAATYTFAEGRVFFESLLNALGSGVTYIKIAEGTQFTFGSKVFELEKDFAIAKESGAWTVKEEPAEPVKFQMTSIVESEVRNGHLLINTNIDDFASYGINILTLCTGTGNFLAGANVASAATQTWGATYSFAEGRVFFESLLNGLGATTAYVKFSAGMQFVWGTKVFELDKDFILVKESGVWEVRDTDPVIPPTKVKITGIKEIYVVRDSGNPLDGLTEMYLTTNTTWARSDAPTNLTGQSLKVGDADETLVSIRPENDGVMVFNHFAGANMAEDMVITIPAGITFVLDGTTYEIEEDFVFTYDGGTGGTLGLPPDITGYSYEDVTLSAIYVQGGYDIYLTTGIADTHEYNNILFKKAGIQVLKADGSTDQIKNFKMHPDSGNLFMAFSYWTEEGTGIYIPKGSIGVNHDKQWGVRFTDDFGLIYKNGQWVVDNDAPAIVFQGGILADGELYGLRLGMSEADMKALFVAEDAIQGQREVEFTCPPEMFAGDALQAGTYDITVTARDNSGNVASYDIKVKGFSKDAPTITFEGDSVQEFDAGKKFDTGSLKAKAKDANGKVLPVTFSYSEDALDRKGNMKKGSHILYIATVDDEGQPARTSVVLNCYEFTDIKVTGIYYFVNDDVFLSTNLKDKAEAFEGVVLTADKILVNGKAGVIADVTVDQNSKSLHILCKKTAGDVVRIHEGATFVNNEKYVGIRVGNHLQIHTDGIGWVNDRIPRSGNSGSAGNAGEYTSPQMGDSNSWYGYLCVCILAAGAVGAVCWKKRREIVETQ